MADWQDDDVVATQYEGPENLAARAVLYARFATSDQSLHEWLFDQFDLPEDASVLSLGAGHGAFWAENADRVPPGWDVTVTDASQGMMMDAMETLEEFDREFNFDVVDARDIPYPEDSFDAVTAHHVLYHLDEADREQAYEAVRRVLAPGGELYASTSGEDHLAELYDVASDYDDVESDLSFTLESGGEELREQFDDVERHRFDDSLRVTDPEPLVAYLLSLPDFDGTHAQALEQEFRDRIGDDAFEITTDAGLFVAR
jgi:SAM-dependent methyltransferase